MDDCLYGKRPPNRSTIARIIMVWLYIGAGLGIRIGEAANPGPRIKVRSSNVSSLRAALPSISDWDRHLTCTQESRHSTPGTAILQKELSRVQWKGTWGHPMRLRSPGPWDTEYGGVAVLSPTEYPRSGSRLDGRDQSSLGNRKVPACLCPC